MIPEAKVRELVEAHKKLDEPMTAAVWIRRDAPEVWLLELIPTMADDDKAEEPTHFNPGVEFRFPLALIAGNRKSLEAALQRAPDLAREVAAGLVVFDEGGDARALVELARSVDQVA